MVTSTSSASTECLPDSVRERCPTSYTSRAELEQQIIGCSKMKVVNVKIELHVVQLHNVSN